MRTRRRFSSRLLFGAGLVLVGTSCGDPTNVPIAPIAPVAPVVPPVAPVREAVPESAAQEEFEERLRRAMRVLEAVS